MISDVETPSGRESYLSYLRYHLRGYPSEFVDDCVRQIRAQIKDAVEDQLTDADRMLTNAERARIEKWVNAPISSHYQRGKPSLAEALEYERYQKELHAQDLIERAVVSHLLPAKEMAARFRAVFLRKAWTDPEPLRWDAATFGFAAIVLVSTPTIPWVGAWLWHTVGIIATGVAVASAVLRRVPTGRITPAVHKMLSWTGYGAITGAVLAGLVGIDGVIGDLSIAVGSHGWSLVGHLRHLDLHIVALVCAALLGRQTRALTSHDHLLRRYVDLDFYRSERYGALCDDVWLQKRSTDYFAEETL